MLPYYIFGPRYASASCLAYFTTKQPKRLHRLYHQPAHAILLCQRIAHKGGTGISTSCPSPTTFVLGLGPDLPWADEPSPGNLGLSTCKFLAYISLLIPAFSLLHRPQLLTVLLQPMHDAPLPIMFTNTTVRVFYPLRNIWRISLSTACGRNSLICPSSALPRTSVFVNMIPKLRWCVLAPDIFGAQSLDQ